MKKIIVVVLFAFFAITTQAQTTPSQDSLRSIKIDTSKKKMTRPMTSDSIRMNRTHPVTRDTLLYKNDKDKNDKMNMKKDSIH